MKIMIVFGVMVLSLFSGCSKAPEQYGNFAQIDSTEMVQDTLTVLLSTYSPAKTHLRLLQAADDSFGLQLIEAIRGNGYAVAEYVEPVKSIRNKIGVSTDLPTGLGFAYILDRFKQGEEMRLTIHVGDETLSRLYLIQGAGMDARYMPAGYWVRKQ